MFMINPQTTNPQFRKFWQNIAQVCLKTVLQVVFLNNFYLFKFELEHYMLYL